VPLGVVRVVSCHWALCELCRAIGRTLPGVDGEEGESCLKRAIAVPLHVAADWCGLLLDSASVDPTLMNPSQFPLPWKT